MIRMNEFYSSLLTRIACSCAFDIILELHVLLVFTEREV